MPFDIPLELDTLDEVPENFKSLYVQEGTHFVYKDPKVIAESMRRAKEEKQSALDKIRTLEQSLNSFKGVDLKQYEELLSLREKYQQVEQLTNGEVERVKHQIAQTYEERLAFKNKELEAVRQTYASEKRDEALKSALRQTGVIENYLEDAVMLISRSVSVDWDGLTPKFSVLDQSGKHRLNKEADPMSLADLAMEYRERIPALFQGRAQGGSGSGGNIADNVVPPSNKKPSSWTERQKSTFMAENGHEAYLALVYAENKLKD